MQHEQGTSRPAYDGKSYQARAELVAECKRIATIAAPTDSVLQLAAKTGLTKSTVGRRLRAMERDLGLELATMAERAAARFNPDTPTTRRAGAIARRWRRHCL